MLYPVLISVPHKNTIQIPLTSKRRRHKKFCLVDARSQALLFTVIVVKGGKRSGAVQKDCIELK